MGLPHHAACLSGAHLKEETPKKISSLFFDFQRQRALLRASIGPPSKQAASCPRSQIGGSHWKQTPFGWYVAAILTAALIFVVQSAEKVLTSVCFFSLTTRHEVSTRSCLMFCAVLFTLWYDAHRSLNLHSHNIQHRFVFLTSRSS